MVGKRERTESLELIKELGNLIAENDGFGVEWNHILNCGH
jgi:hypothetical protein